MVNRRCLVGIGKTVTTKKLKPQIWVNVVTEDHLTIFLNSPVVFFFCRWWIKRKSSRRLGSIFAELSPVKLACDMTQTCETK